MDFELSVIALPVSDTDAAIQYYVERVGFHLDHDVRPADGLRVVQLTPPGSACSVVIGEGMPLGDPPSTTCPQLVVSDIETAVVTLADRGVAISDVHQMGPVGMPGSRFAFFTDPDGNPWSLQEMQPSGHRRHKERT